MIACGSCQVWQHVECNSLKVDQLETISFTCKDCVRFIFLFLFFIFDFSYSFIQIITTFFFPLEKRKRKLRN